MPAPRKQPGPGRPKDLEKRAAILEAAKRLFPQRGFDGVSMDAIATEAGVSKLTVYSHFTDKDTLFVESVKEKCEEQLPEALFRPGGGKGPIREQLLDIARGFYSLIISDEAVELQRMMAAQAHHPNAAKLAQMFYEAGPRRVLGEFQRFLQQRVATDALDIPDPTRAAGHFFCLIKGEMHLRLLIGCCRPVPCAEAEEHLASVVDLFVRAYGRRD